MGGRAQARSPPRSDGGRLGLKGVGINTRARTVWLAIGAVVVVLIVIRLATDTVLISQMALGLGTGSLIAGIALGVVLTYRGAGVVDFSKGAVAIFIGYVFHELRTNGRIVIPPLPNPLALVEGIVNSGRSKPDWIDLPNWPTFIDLPGARQTFLSALVMSILYAALLGLILHFVVFRPLRFAPPLAKVVASVGLFIVFQAIVLLRFGGTTQLPQKILDDRPRRFFGDVVIPQNQLVLALLVVALAVVLYALFRFTRFGLATRAAAENEKGAIVLGFSPDFLAGANWVLATVIVGLFGIIVSPITTLDPISVPLLDRPCPRRRARSVASPPSASRSPPAWGSACCRSSPCTTAPSTGSRSNGSRLRAWPSRSRSS